MEPQASLSNLQGARAELEDQATQTAQLQETRDFSRSRNDQSGVVNGLHA